MTILIIPKRSSVDRLMQAYPKGEPRQHTGRVAYKRLDLTNDKLLLVVVEGVFWDLEVEWSGTSSNSTRDIVVGTVTWAEPSSVITSLSNGDTTKMGAVKSVRCGD